MKITCNLIRDLMPLYVDQILSEDSKNCVVEHIKDCNACRNLLHDMKMYSGTDAHRGYEEVKILSTYPQEEKKAFRHLKNKIRNRVIGITVIGIVAACLITWGGQQYYYFHRSDITYADSGLYVEDNKLCSNQTLDGGRLQAFVSPDQTVWFINCSETAYAKHEFPSKEGKFLVYDFDEIWTGESEALGTAVDPRLREVYYISLDQADEVQRIWNETNPNQAKEMLGRLEENAQLVWKTTTSSIK